MRTLLPDFASHIAGDVTTLCHCFRIKRDDGVMFGFTDHDLSLSFDGTVFMPHTGFDATEARTSFGLASSDMQISGAVSSESLTDEDINHGRYDGAKVEIWRVNWADAEQRALIRVGVIGEIKRRDNHLLVTLNGALHQLDKTKGRVYAQDCDAVLGDGRCQVNLDKAGFQATTVVLSRPFHHTLTAEGLSTFEDHWFTHGLLSWEDGASAGRTGVIGSFTTDNEGVSFLQFDGGQSFDFAIGDRFSVTVGCDRRASTCASKFNNMINFQGFPFMPGQDYLFSYGRRG